MASEDVESARPGQWERCYGFRLVLLSTEQEQIKFLGNLRTSICHTLTDTYFEFMFDADGHLLMREQKEGLALGRIRPGPVWIHENLVKFFGALGLDTSPVSQPIPMASLREWPVNANRNAVHGKFAATVRSLFGLLKQSPATPPAPITPFPTWDERQEHARRQFEILQDWLAQQWQAGKLVLAMQNWYRDHTEPGH